MQVMTGNGELLEAARSASGGTPLRHFNQQPRCKSLFQNHAPNHIFWRGPQCSHHPLIHLSESEPNTLVCQRAPRGTFHAKLVFSRCKIAGSCSLKTPARDINRYIYIYICICILMYTCTYTYTMGFVPQADRCQKVLSQLVTQILPHTFPNMFFEVDRPLVSLQGGRKSQHT